MIIIAHTYSYLYAVKLSANDVIHHQPANTVFSKDEEIPFNCLEEIEGKTIGNLLPDEDDLFNGIDVLAHNTCANNSDEFEDFDLFSNGGGLELGEDGLSVIHRKHDLVGGVSNGQVGCNGSVAGEHPCGELPSRTLFVRNINSNIEDSELKALFEVLILPILSSFIFSIPCNRVAAVFLAG